MKRSDGPEENAVVAREYTEAEVWAIVGRRLRKRSIPATVRRRIGPPHINDDSDLDHFVDTVSLHLLKLRNRRVRARRVADKVAASVNSSLSADEHLREQVMRRELARLATRHLEAHDEATKRTIPAKVVGFRTAIFGAARCSPKLATRVLLSAAASHLDGKFFSSRNVSVLDVSATIHGRSQGFDTTSRFAWEGIDLEINWGDQAIRSVFKYALRDGFTELSVRPDPLVQAPLRFRVAKGSVLAEVGEFASELATLYLWDASDAAWFILSGEVPVTPCFRASIEQSNAANCKHLRLTLSIQPWVSAKTVNRVYRHFQQRILGKENRAPKAESLKFLDFVSPRLHRGASWVRTMNEWNRAYPRQRYKPRGIGNFKRDFESIYRLVVWPPYEIHQWQMERLSRRPR